nr:integrase, catalytic region, zinc finger, CCHC-type, peptidase aspartic, catalytic [Tanacetum cinerariifolium]
ERTVKREVEEIETLNIELDHQVTKLIAENEHLKQTYKQLYDSIKSSCVRSKEQCDDLINKVNLKSAEVSDLNASLQEKVLVITALKEQLNKLKGKANRTTHIDYIRHTKEEAATLREIVESKRLLSPLNTSLDYACKAKGPGPSVVNQAPEVIAPIVEVIPLVHADSTSSPSSTTVDQDAPSPSKSHTTIEIQSSVIPQDVRDDNLDMEVAHMGNDLLFGVPIPEVTSVQSSSTTSPQSITYKVALTQSCWIEAMQEELNEFDRLEVWKLVPRPDQVMVITLKWIYKVKLDEVGGILKNKARLVA